MYGISVGLVASSVCCRRLKIRKATPAGIMAAVRRLACLVLRCGALSTLLAYGGRSEEGRRRRSTVCVAAVVLRWFG